jgi:hypothetical protein
LSKVIVGDTSLAGLSVGISPINAGTVRQPCCRTAVVKINHQKMVRGETGHE